MTHNPNTKQALRRFLEGNNLFNGAISVFQEYNVSVKNHNPMLTILVPEVVYLIKNPAGIQNKKNAIKAS